MLQGALELGCVAAQQIERLGAVDDQARGDVAAVVDVEPHVDAAELGRIEADLEAVVPGLRARRDLDREPCDRHRGGRPARRSRCGIGDAGCGSAVAPMRETAELDGIDRRLAARRGVGGFALIVCLRRRPVGCWRGAVASARCASVVMLRLALWLALRVSRVAVRLT